MFIQFANNSKLISFNNLHNSLAARASWRVNRTDITRISRVTSGTHRVCYPIFHKPTVVAVVITRCDPPATIAINVTNLLTV